MDYSITFMEESYPADLFENKVASYFDKTTLIFKYLVNYQPGT